MLQSVLYITLNIGVLEMDRCLRWCSAPLCGGERRAGDCAPADGPRAPRSIAAPSKQNFGHGRDGPQLV